MRDPERMKAIAARLRPVAGEDAALEAGFLLDYAAAHPDADCNALLERRVLGEPLQYVLGEWEFMGLPMRTDARALIPRPDTEILCEAALKRIRPGARVLDLCCGSGCIGIALAKLGGAVVTASDISPDALALARENAAWNGVSLTLVRSDLFADIAGTFDLIVSNPPYLDAEEMAGLDASVRFEPALALDGGPDGLSFYRRIRADYARFLNPGGALLLEIGYRQKDAVTALFGNADCLYDYGNRPRCAVVEKP